MGVHDHDDKKLALPEGKTCDTCVHAEKCFTLGFSDSESILCDYHPNAYKERK